MIRSFLLVLLVGAALPASAAWTEYGDVDEYTFYVDLNTVLVDGDVRNVWTMANLKNRNSYGSLSSRSKVEINCKKGMARGLDFASFSQPNLGGEIITRHVPPAIWDHIPPGTSYADLMRLVCK